MMLVGVHEAKTHFSRLLAAVERGEEVVIERAGHPVARLVAYAPAQPRRLFGQDAGRFTVAEDFDEPMPIVLFTGDAGFEPGE
jgi:prevent-host-death family protein